MKRIGIIGLGRVGRSILAYLMDRDAEILLYDENPRAFLHKYVKVSLEDKKVRRLTNPQDLKEADLLIKSPGIPNEAEWIKELDALGIPIVDEIEFVWKELGEPTTVAVTGTNGKSTTTAWTASVLKTGGMKVFCGGNLAPGKPFAEALKDSPYDAYVIEVSTFQLERCPTFRPKVGVLLNVTADHLNRHSPDDYVNLKLSLFKNHSEEDFAVLNADDEETTKHLEGIKGEKRFFSLRRKDVAAYLDKDTLFLSAVPVIERKDLPLPGLHNAANALAATAVAAQFGFEPKVIRKGLMKFRGLPHRMQYLGELEGRVFYNNSMCTNPAAFYNSVRAFDESSVVIAGGTEKGLPLEPFLAGVKERARFLILFGENAERLKEIVLTRLHFSSCVVVDSLRAAVIAALENSRPGERVLFAPGFASFGNFKNFEERGHAFIKAYREIKNRI